ncbi:MAG: hypothetical protein AAFX40_06560 [Cyanobacteria bacterium J06639_1]
MLLTIPYELLYVIPPQIVLNDLLMHGRPGQYGPVDGIYPDGTVQVDAGMSGGCAWKPFHIDREEYDELVEELLTDPELQLHVLEPPAYVRTHEQWQRWRPSHLYRHRKS